MSRGEGWAWPANARRDHYFVEWMSLCGKWLFYGEFVEDEGIKKSDDCVDCHRRLRRRKVGV